MARRMSEKDKIYLAKSWGYNPEIDNVVPNKPIQAETKSTPKKVIADENIKLQRSLEKKLLRTTTDKQLIHPCFGELVFDSNYKKTYITNVQSNALNIFVNSIIIALSSFCFCFL